MLTNSGFVFGVQQYKHIGMVALSQWRYLEHHSHNRVIQNGCDDHVLILMEYYGDKEIPSIKQQWMLLLVTTLQTVSSLLRDFVASFNICTPCGYNRLYRSYR